MSPAPVVAEVVVPVPPTQAFVGFTAQMGEWWDPLLSADPATFTGVEVDPDGEVATCHGKERHVWGRVLTWEPTGHYVQEFWLGRDEGEASVVDVRFTEDDGGGTLVHLEHRGWPDGPGSVDDLRAQWEDLLQRYAAFVS